MRPYDYRSLNHFPIKAGVSCCLVHPHFGHSAPIAPLSNEKFADFGNLFMNESIFPENPFEYLIDNSLFSMAYERFTQFTHSVDNAVDKPTHWDGGRAFIDQ
jgi:hypothetical protein